MKYVNNIIAKFFPLIVLALVLLAIFVQYKDIAALFRDKVSIEPTLQDVQAIFPDAASFELFPDPQKWGEVYDQNKQCLGYVIGTSPYMDHISGFGGPVPILIACNLKQELIAIRLLANAESESFVADLTAQGFMKKWDGLALPQALEKKVDAVSGATMTSSAIVQTVRERLALVSASNVTQTTDFNWKKLIYQSLGVLVVVFALLSFTWPKKFAKYRIILLLSNVIVLGFLNGYALSLAIFYRWLLNGIPVLVIPLLSLIAFLAIGVALATNVPFYCTVLCPYGSAQELVGKILSKRPKLSEKILRYLKHSREVVLAVLVILLVIGLEFDLTHTEPFSAFLLSYASIGVLVMASFFLVVSLFFPRFWCRFLCPTGAFLEIFSHKPQPSTLSSEVQKVPVLNAEEEENKNMKFYKTVIVLLLVVIIMILVKPHLPVFSGNGEGGSALTVIHQRKSVRQYKPEPVTEKQIDILIRAAMAAPTAADKRPWSFIVVTDRAQLDALAEGLPYAKMLKQAPAAIIVCGVLEKCLPGEEAAFWIQDCSVASQNILLAAEAIGLGAVWTAVYPMKDREAHVRKILQIPEGVIPLNVIPFGHPVGIEKPKNKYDAANIHQNKW